VNKGMGSLVDSDTEVASETDSLSAVKLIKTIAMGPTS